MKLPKTKGMVYPSWYPDYQYIAADVSESPRITGDHLTAQINAVSGPKTSVRDARRERFDFLGYAFGPHHFRKDGRLVSRCQSINE